MTLKGLIRSSGFGRVLLIFRCDQCKYGGDSSSSSQHLLVGEQDLLRMRFITNLHGRPDYNPAPSLSFISLGRVSKRSHAMLGSVRAVGWTYDSVTGASLTVEDFFNLRAVGIHHILNATDPSSRGCERSDVVA